MQGKDHIKTLYCKENAISLWCKLVLPLFIYYYLLLYLLYIIIYIFRFKLFFIHSY